MARDTRRAFLRLLDQQAPLIGAAFRQSIRDMLRGLTRDELRALSDAVGRQDINAALRVLAMDAATLAPLSAAAMRAYGAGGAYQTTAIVSEARREGAVIRAGFDPGNPRAAVWAQQNAARLVGEITDEARETVRDLIAASLRDGRNPNDMALDLVGRLQGNVRRGGVIGLDSHRAGYVQNMRDDLRNLDARYFTRTRRDRRFDSIVRRAIAEGRPVAQADIDRIAGRYADRLLVTRARGIGRSEALPAAHAGRHESIEQLIDGGRIQAATKSWDSTGHDNRTRESHLRAEEDERNQNIPLDQDFIVGGYRMAYPGDRSKGAPASETVNCRCYHAVRIER